MVRKIFSIIVPVIAGVLMNCSVARAAEHSLFNGCSPVQAGSPAADGSFRDSDRVLSPVGAVEGRLKNGLSYVLMPNASPSKMIECRLVFRAGSVLETEENRGAAHFLEHMAFGGTKHFPGRKLVDYLESLGAQYGENINAYTGYDRTIYMFSIPSDRAEYLDNALLILKDWLVDITLDPKKVEGEKGIILEELRGYNTGDDFYNLKIGTGLYSRGIPLGTEEDIKNITPDVLKAFHDKWYTLSQATVVLVGDIDVQDAVRRIDRTFGSLKATSSPEYRDYPHEYAPGTTYAEVCDTLLNRGTFELMIPHSCVLRDNLGDAVLNARYSMLVSVLSKRLGSLNNRASLSNNWYLADKDHFCISVSARDRQGALEEMSKTVRLLYDAAEKGFSDAELKCYISSYLKNYRLIRGTVNSSVLCDAIEDAILFDDRVITDRSQHEWIKARLAETTSEELQAILRDWLNAGEGCRLAAWRYNPLISDGFTAAEVDSLWFGAKASRREDFVFVEPEPEPEPERTAIPDFLVRERKFDKNMIHSRTYHKNIGVTDVMLENGFRFVLRPTRDEDNNIQLQLFAPGGLSRVPEDEFAAYEGTAGYMELGGIEGLGDDDWFSILTENGIGIITAMESYWHGMLASAPASSLRLMLNMLYGKMISPRLDYEEFDEVRQSELEDFGEESYLSKLMKLDVQRQLNLQIDSLMGNLMYGRRTELTREDLENLNLDRIAGFYKKLYGNPTGMTCVVCGAFDVDEFLREAVPLFGAMPAGEEPCRMGESHFILPQTSRKLEFPNANETQTVFDYLRFGTYEPSLRSGLKLKLMNNLVRNRLLTVLREQESLVYSPYAALFYTARPDNVFYIDINASVERGNTARVHEILDSIIEDLQAHKVTKQELDNLKRIFIINKRKALEDDATSAWKTYLVGQLKNEETLAELDLYEDVLFSITRKELRDEFRRCFDTDRFMILSMGPFESRSR